MSPRSRGEVDFCARERICCSGPPEGSYRLAHVLAYLRWAVRASHAVPDQPRSLARAGEDAASAEARARARAAAGLPAEERQLVVVLDWFAPHLDERVDEELESSGAACLRIGGGLTGDVQVCVTHIGMGH